MVLGSHFMQIYLANPNMEEEVPVPVPYGLTCMFCCSFSDSERLNADLDPAF
jgi:hypothetical protein